MNFILGGKFKFKCIVVLLTAIAVILFNPFYSTHCYTLTFKAYSDLNTIKPLKVLLNSSNDREDINNYELCFPFQVDLTNNPKNYSFDIPYKAFKKTNFVRIELLNSANLDLHKNMLKREQISKLKN